MLESAPARQTPFCPVYEQCGGCQLQHVERDAALAWRQQALDEQIRLTHALDELPWVAPLRSPREQYRRKTRLAIDARKGKPLALGFRAPKSDKVVNVRHCPVLEPELNNLLPLLHELLEQLSGRAAIGHISLLKAHNGIGVTLRCTKALSANDRSLLVSFAETHKLLLRVDSGEHSETLHASVDELLCATANDLSLAVTTGYSTNAAKLEGEKINNKTGFTIRATMQNIGIQPAISHDYARLIRTTFICSNSIPATVSTVR